MPHHPAKMSSQAQPAVVREHCKLNSGDTVDFYFDDA
jgi:hypothetical protein